MDEAEKKKLWEEYAKGKTPETRERLILEYAPLVKLVAGRLSMYLGYNVEYDDLVSYGIFGLIDAIDKFDSMKDWIPRTIRQRQKKMEAVTKEIEAAKGRSATDEEIAQALGLTGEEYGEWQSQMKITNVVSLNEFMEQGAEVPAENNKSAHFASPEEVLEKEELKTVLADALSILTEKERRVIELYYYEDLTLKEISNILEVSESRISQLHTRGLQKLKSKMGNYMGIFA